MENFEKNARFVFAIPLGFLFGIMLSSVFQLAAVTSWYFFIGFLVLAGFFFLESRYSEKMSLRVLRSLSDRPKEEVQAISEKIELARKSKLPKQVFAISCLFGIIVTVVFPAQYILKVLQWVS